MKISEILAPSNRSNNSNISENATSGASSAGGVASVAQPFGHVMSRQPNLFGYMAPLRKKKKPATKSSKKHT
jgi:hypothetical protein